MNSRRNPGVMMFVSVNQRENKDMTGNKQVSMCESVRQTK